MPNKQLNSVEQESTGNNSSLNQPGSRRKFFKKAAIGSALITTVSSRSVLAAGCTMSGNLSNNTSGQHDIPPGGCSYNIVSPGGWLNGIASGNAGSNPSLWPYTGQSRTSPLADLFPSTSFAGTIEDALGGGNHGFERQLACAALNSLLFEYININCTSTTCDIFADLPSTFYWTVSYDEIVAIYNGGEYGPDASKYDWDAIQNID